MNPVLALWYAFLSKAYIAFRTTQLWIHGMDPAEARREAMVENQKSCGEHYLVEKMLAEEYEKTYKWMVNAFGNRSPSESEITSLANMVEQLNKLLASKEFESERFQQSVFKIRGLAQKILTREPK